MLASALFTRAAQDFASKRYRYPLTTNQPLQFSDASRFAQAERVYSRAKQRRCYRFGKTDPFPAKGMTRRRCLMKQTGDCFIGRARDGRATTCGQLLTQNSEDVK